MHDVTQWRVQSAVVSRFPIGISRMGKTRIVFVEQSAKVNNKYYCQRAGRMPSDTEDASDTRAPCYRTARRRRHTLSITPRRSIYDVTTDNITFEPPNSPDIKPVDYVVWVHCGALQQMLYRQCQGVRTCSGVPPNMFPSHLNVGSALKQKLRCNYRLFLSAGQKS